MIKIALKLFLILSLITGILYPVFVTALGQIISPCQASGSILKSDDKLLGSSLIGQEFQDPKYLWGRASVTAAFPYDSSASSASNLAPSNPVLLEQIKARLAKFDQNNVPVELVTTSASGLDPHINLRSAMFQVSRIAKARGVSNSFIANVIRRNTERKLFGLIGEEVVNVLHVNLDLDNVKVQCKY